VTRHPCRVNRLEHAARVAVRAGSLLAALAMTVGVPTGLAAFVGWPLPRSVPIDWAGWMVVLSTEIPDAAVAHLLAAALWIVWAAFCYSLAVEAVAALRGRPAPRIRLISPLQAAAALLVAGMAAAPVAAAAAATVTAAQAPPAVPVAATSPALTRDTGTAAHQPPSDPVAVFPPAAGQPPSSAAVRICRRSPLCPPAAPWPSPAAGDGTP